MSEPETNPKVAILIVNGGRDPEPGRWIDLCLSRIREHSQGWNYRIFVWDNNRDSDLAAAVAVDDAIEYMECAPYETLGHAHAYPLQRLYARALCWSPKYIVTMDSDAFPIRDGWLGELTAALEVGNVLAGVWRDELSAGIEPYIHPSCLCTTPEYIEQSRLRFDFIASADTCKKHDTLSEFTEHAVREGLHVYPLRRSNKNEFHRLMGGIYGDLIYHHGAGSRNTVRFHGDGFTKEASLRYRMLRDQSANALFNDYWSYIGWLRGTELQPPFQNEAYKHTDANGATSDSEPTMEGTGFFNTMVGALRHLKATFGHRVESRLSSVKDLRSSLLKRQSGRGATGPEASNRLVTDSMTRPFGHSDLAPLPRGWTSGAPDFVGVGVPKAGTSWLYNMLLQHPQIVPNRVLRQSRPLKETHYFIHYAGKSLPEPAADLYREAFARPSGAVCGEFSTTYLQYPGAIRLLAECAPETKVIVVLRNPIDRMASGMNHLSTHRARRLGVAQSSNDWAFLTKYAWSIEAYHYSLYARAIESLLDAFPRTNITVLLYEELVLAPMEHIGRAIEFLDLGDTYPEMRYSEAVNRQPYLIPKPTETERDCLAAEFRSDVEHLKHLLPDVDFSIWGEFS